MEILPIALSVGMTEEDFWKSNPRMLSVYIDAHNIAMEEADKLNWYLGMYIRDAIASCFSDSAKYAKAPIMKGFREEARMTEEERETKEMYMQIASMRAWAEKEQESGLK